jgi:septal ring factor EnvC (AmiA/AmiB activator)
LKSAPGEASASPIDCEESLMNTDAHGMTLSAPAVEPGTKVIESHFLKVAFAINEQSKALISARDKLTNLDRNSASAFQLIANSITAINNRLARLEAELAAMRPHIEDMKVHATSFPHALRAARRSDAAVQEAQEAIEARLREIELKLEEREGRRKERETLP